MRVKFCKLVDWLILFMLVYPAVLAYYPPVSRRYFLQHRMKWPRPEAIMQSDPLLGAGLRAPPFLRVMSGPPGSPIDMLEKDEQIKRWYVAPPGGVQGEQADWADVERTPVGPPGSDAAAMGRGEIYGPPGLKQDEHAVN